MQRARGSLAPSFSSTSTFLAKQQVVSQRMTNDVLSAKNSNISDNLRCGFILSWAIASRRRRCKTHYTCLYLRWTSTRRFTLMHTTQIHFMIHAHENRNLQSHKSFPCEFAYSSNKISLNSIPYRNYSFLTKKFAGFNQNDF